MDYEDRFEPPEWLNNAVAHQTVRKWLTDALGQYQETMDQLRFLVIFSLAKQVMDVSEKTTVGECEEKVKSVPELNAKLLAMSPRFHEIAVQTHRANWQEGLRTVVINRLP